MSNYKKFFGAILSSLLLSGTAFGHGVQNEASGDVISGHSSDHKDSVLMNPSNSQAPVMGESRTQDSEDLTEQIVRGGELSASTSSPPDAHSQSGHDNQDDVVHVITNH